MYNVPRPVRAQSDDIVNCRQRIPMRTATHMTTHGFATVSIRLLGVAAIAVGLVFAGSIGAVHLLRMSSPSSTSISDLHLHDTYYIVSQVEDAWLAPGLVSALTGVILLVISRRLAQRWPVAQTGRT